jgi:hypothetical protein
MNEKETDSHSAIWLSPLVLNEDLSVQFRGDHIHVEMGPHFTTSPDRQSKFWEQIKKVCDEHGSKRVLVEGFVPGGERQTSDVVAAARWTDAIPNLWMAFHLKNFEQDERSELFKVVAGIKGVRVKFFGETEQALTWLRRNTPA